MLLITLLLLPLLVTLLPTLLTTAATIPYYTVAITPYYPASSSPYFTATTTPNYSTTTTTDILPKISFHPPVQRHFVMTGNHRVCEYLSDTSADRMFLFKRAVIPEVETENVHEGDQVDVNS